MKKGLKALLVGSLILPAVMIIGCGKDKNFTVNFAGYGQGSYPSITITDEGAKLYEPEAPTREGYIFDGWFIGDKEWNFDTDIVMSDITLTAKWTPIQYTITYVSDGGVLPEGTRTTYTIEDSFQLNVPTKNGYYFYGWYDSNDWDNGASLHDTLVSAGTTGDITLYAKWDKYTPEGKLIVHNAERLDFLRTNLDTDAVLFNDIDLNGAEWTPIGSRERPYTGDFDGNDYKISNYKITTQAENIGFFVATANNTIKNLTLDDFDINIVEATCNLYIGGLTSIANNTTITNCHTTGAITANTTTNFDYWSYITITFIGGLVQQSTTCTITQCSAINTITTKQGSEEVAVYVGGLVEEATNNSLIDQCFTSGTITLNNTKGICAGGISERIQESTISNSYSLCDIVAVCDFQNGISLGGITRFGSNAVITNCYFDGDLSATNKMRDGLGASVSGIVDSIRDVTTVSNCYVNGNLYASIKPDYLNTATAAGINNSNRSISPITNCYQSDTTTLSAVSDAEEYAITINHSTIASLADIYTNLQTVWDSNIWEFDGNNMPKLKAFNK